MWSRDVRINNCIAVAVKNKCSTDELKATSFAKANGRFCLQQLKNCLNISKNSKPCTRLAELLKITVGFFFHFSFLS